MVKNLKGQTMSSFIINLFKNNRIIGKNKEFLSENGSPLAFGDVSEFLTGKFLYDLRKLAMTIVCPIDIMWHIIGFIEKHRKHKRGQSREEDHSLDIVAANIFCSAFGVGIVEAKFVMYATVYDETFENWKDMYVNDLQACIDLYRDEWEALIKEYEMEHGES